jgi:hypothetical protein
MVQQLLPAIQQKNRISFIDQVAFPTEIFYLNLQFLQSVMQLNNSLAEKEPNQSIIQQKSAAMKNSLVNLRNKLAAGSGWEKWKDFYKPENFRIHTPPPTLEMIDKIIAGL